MTPARRIALLAAVVVVAVVGLIVLKPDEGSKKQSSEPTGTTTPANTGTGKERTKPAQPPSPPVANVQVRNGKPVGGVRKLEFSKGETVDFFVTSDVADHVHLHGYDVMEDVGPGQPASFNVKAGITGIFEAELEDRGVQIISVRVNP